MLNKYTAAVRLYGNMHTADRYAWHSGCRYYYTIGTVQLLKPHLLYDVGHAAAHTHTHTSSGRSHS
jgi:hypothetical protein